MKTNRQPSLYGIKNSNRDFSSPYAWGKNQFNSAFPASLACYMRDKNIPAVFIRHGNNEDTVISELSFDDFWQTSVSNDKLKFLFEYRYTPFSKLTIDDIPPIDLVIADNESEKLLVPVEIKLTTLPDNATAIEPESGYGSELVIRSPTMKYVAMGMGMACAKEINNIREIFTPVCAKIRNWDNIVEVSNYKVSILEALGEFLNAYHHLELPLLMQPIWKTEGKVPKLAKNCLDIFIWSNFALCRLLLASESKSSENITRPQRSALRLARFLYDLSTKKQVYQKPIYDGMTYDNLNDKEFAVSGKRTNPYMRCERLTKPIVQSGEIKEIIKGGGQKFLSPERRFDAIIYYSTEIFTDD